MTVTATDIIGDSAGGGSLIAGGNAVLTCMRGDCGRIKYKRKALAVDTYALGVCEPSEMCDAMVDEVAPEDAGTATIEWSFCSSVITTDCPSGAYCPDLVNTQSAAVAIMGVYPGLQWNAGTCWWNIVAGNEDCRTVIEVDYLYTDSFDHSYFQDIDGCDESTVTYSFSQGWRCYYSRRVAAGQYFAEGPHALVRCEYSSAASTWGPTGGCGIPGGTVCSADGLTPITPPTLWKPPSYVNLVRYS